MSGRLFASVLGAMCLSGCAITNIPYYSAPAEGQASATLVFVERFERQDTTVYSGFEAEDCPDNERSGLIAVAMHGQEEAPKLQVRAGEALFLTSERSAIAPGVYQQWCVSQVSFTPQASATYEVRTRWNDSQCQMDVRDVSGQSITDLQVLKPGPKCYRNWLKLWVWQ